MLLKTDTNLLLSHLGATADSLTAPLAASAASVLRTKPMVKTLAQHKELVGPDVQYKVQVGTLKEHVGRRVPGTAGTT